MGRGNQLKWKEEGRGRGTIGYKTAVLFGGER
jgi:hypothetical protein